MCLFCSMTRRQAFRRLIAAAVGGAAHRLAAPAIRSPLAGVAHELRSLQKLARVS
jgi:hypothetical protein